MAAHLCDRVQQIERTSTKQLKEAFTEYHEDERKLLNAKPVFEDSELKETLKNAAHMFDPYSTTCKKIQDKCKKQKK